MSALWWLPAADAAAVIVVLLGPLLLPPLTHIWAGWSVRRSEIVDALSEDAIRCYFRQFYPTLAIPRERLSAFFRAHYNSRYGRRHYVVPFIVLSAVAVIFLGICARIVTAWSLKQGVPADLGAVVVAAVAGAYSWVVLDTLVRYRRRELAPVDLYWSALRFLISVPLALSLTTLLKNDAAVAVAGAYLLGTFPTRMLFTLGRRIVTRRFGLGEAGEEGRSELETLQGITPGMAERLQDEGVSTILQLAYWNPVDLAIRANLSFNFAIDIVSQALAWLYLEESLVAARKFSLRGAYEIHTTVRDLTDGDEQERAIAQATVSGLAEVIKLDPQVLLGLLTQIAEDPYTQFNYAIWGADASHGDADAPPSS